jgi:hypothetical protein
VHQGKAKCNCESGYHPEGLECIQDADPCEDVTCSGHGTCVVDKGNPTCQCDPGYHPEGLECLPDDSCDPANLRQDALSNGNEILNGLTLTQSTPIVDILADPDSYAGQLVQVEGLVAYICPRSQNRLALRDPDGNQLQVAGNFTVPWPVVTSVGRYMVVEGVYTLFFCRRGPHVNPANHGAMAGTIVCPVR